MHESERWKRSHSVVSNPQWPHGLQPTRLLHPWDFPGKSTRVGCHCLLCLSPYHIESILQIRASGDKGTAGTKIARRNINNLSYSDDTILMTESKEALRSFWMKAKEESEKAGLKLNIQKTKIMESSPIISWQIDGKTMETVTDFFLGLQKHCRWWLKPWN